MPILLEDLNLRKAERLLCLTALQKAGSIVEASQLLGVTRHALKRRMIKHRIDWPSAGDPTEPRESRDDREPLLNSSADPTPLIAAHPEG